MARSLDRTLRRTATGVPPDGEADDVARCETLRRSLAARRDPVGDVFEARGGQHTSPLGDEVAKASVSPGKALLIYRLVRLLEPTRVVEFGSCFGVSGAYIASALAAAGGRGRLVTIEGSPSRHAIAGHTIEAAAPGLTTALCGYFEDHLDELDRADLVFLDGNHQVGPTLGYLSEVTARAARPSTIVLDDIRGWSPEFDQMWQRLRRDERFPLAGEHLGMGVLTLGLPPRLEPASRWSVLPRGRS